VLIEFPCRRDASTKQSLLRAVRAAEAQGLGLNIRVALDRAGQAVFLVESLPVPDRCADSGPGDGSADEALPPP
jgi:phosphatidylserine/phosphatidylglycerophosphate/cardiolipin synthase-like enzyme